MSYDASEFLEFLYYVLLYMTLNIIPFLNKNKCKRIFVVFNFRICIIYHQTYYCITLHQDVAFQLSGGYEVSQITI